MRSSSAGTPHSSSVSAGIAAKPQTLCPSQLPVLCCVFFRYSTPLSMALVTLSWSCGGSAGGGGGSSRRFCSTRREGSSCEDWPEEFWARSLLFLVVGPALS